MAQSFDIIEMQLGSAVANAATFTVNYPSRKDAGAYRSGVDHKIATNEYGVLSVVDGTMSISFGASNITVTNKSGGTLAAGTKMWVQLVQAPEDESAMANAEQMTDLVPVLINLGAPDAADADGVCASQALNTGVDGVIDGALASGGVATFDVPRNVVAAWTNTAVITITGTDQYGNVVVESSGSGTSLAGKKAFKTVTKVRISANATGLTVGSGDVLGLPVAITGAARVIREIEDGAAPTAGTVVGADLTKPATATTGDVRGTYDPNSACNGSKVFELIAMVSDPSFKGMSQFAG